MKNENISLEKKSNKDEWRKKMPEKINAIMAEAGIALKEDTRPEDISREGGDLVYRIGGQDCDYVLKIFSDAANPHKFFANLRFGQLAADNNCAPRIIKTSGGSGVLSRLWIIWEWSSGRPICEIEAEGERSEAAVRAGEELRRLHGIKTSGFGRADAHDGWSGDNAGWNCDLFLEEVRGLISRGGRAFSEEEMEKIISLTLNHEKLRDYKDPRLLHGDVAGDNIIYDRSTKAVTFIDPDEVMAGDPMFDLVRSQSPKLGKEFREGVWEGYTRETPLTKEEEDRFELWRLFRQALIACRAVLKNDPQAESYAKAARELLAQIKKE